jgi:hypothetical protein
VTTTIIKTTITQTVTLGSSLYAAVLTITSAGTVAPAAFGATAIYGNGSGEIVENVGNLAGGVGTANSGGNGGIGVELVLVGTVLNKGTILGGDGGSGSNNGGAGGTAVYLAHRGRAANSGTIAGGSGGIGPQDGGIGGIGVNLGTVGTFNNSAWVSGGIGGYGTVGGGAGGAGVYLLSADSFNNIGTVAGGGGTGGTFAGDGGIGVQDIAGTLANSGTIEGGLGGNAVSYGGNGGVGLFLDGGSLSKSGSIFGGTGGTGTGTGNGNGYGYGYGGRGGIGLYATGFGTIVNSGVMQGGGGGTGVHNPSDGGAGAELNGSGTLINSGSISGGTGLVAQGGLGSQQGGAGGVGVDLSGSATAANSGTISGGLGGGGGGYYGGTGGAGAVLADGGTLGNKGAIFGGSGGDGSSGGTGGVGVDLAGSATSVATNAGIISGGAGGVGGGGYGGNGGSGLELIGSGTFTNQAGGTVAGGVGGYGALFGDGTGGTGVDIADGGTVTNNGAISGGGNGGGLGAFLNAGILTNNGTISGGTSGVYVFSGTLVDAGTIIGNQGTAVDFGGTGPNLLVLEPGFTFSGLVIGGSGASNVIELAATGSPGTLTSLGGQLLDFGSIVIDHGADWFIGGNSAGLSGIISGFALGDTIDLTGVTATASSYANGVLTLDEAVGSATLDLPGFSAGQLLATDVSGGTDVTVACFRTGTRIMTGPGEVAVERLRVGDMVQAHGGDGRTSLRRIAWIGHRTIDCRKHPCPRNVWPVRIFADAFGPGRPTRSLWLSPDHAVFIDGFLVPIRHLINGSLVAQAAVDEVTFHHVELESHGIVLAEGMPCESYLDTGNRATLENGCCSAPAGRDAVQVWAKQGCAPLLEDGPIMADRRARLAERAIEMGYGRPPIRDVCVASVGTVKLAIPPEAQGVRLVSRSTRSGGDRRRLGALVSGFRLEGQHYGVADVRLGLGFHDLEHHGPHAARWTDGDAIIDIGRATAARHLELDIAVLKVELDGQQAA